MEVSFPEGGAVEVEGNLCARGAAYAREEAVSPKRMVTALAQVEGALEPLSVKTASPVPKELVLDVLSALHRLRVEAPVRTGDVVLRDVCGTGIDVVATKSAL